MLWTGSSTKRETYEEKYKDGNLKARWQAHTVDGRYLLDGKMTEYYPNGQKQHEVTYENGFKTGIYNINRVYFKNDSIIKFCVPR